MKSLKLSIVAFVLGGCIAITQSSFRPALADIHWGYNQSTGTFVNLTGKVEDNSANPAPGTYSCLASVNICSGFKATLPTSPSQMTSREPGDFILNP